MPPEGPHRGKSQEKIRQRGLGAFLCCWESQIFPFLLISRLLQNWMLGAPPVRSPLARVVPRCVWEAVEGW